MSHIIAGSKMLILFFTIIVMSSINSTSAGETTKHTEIMESTMLTKVIHNIGRLFYGPEIEGSRTFFRKKLQSALLPLMFKLGVLATVVKIILLLSLKAVIIGKILLFINLGFIIAKIAKWKSHEQHNSWQPQGWPMAPWPSPWYPPQQSQPIHVHIHNDKEQPHYVEHDQPYPQYSNPNSGSSGHYERFDSGIVGIPNVVSYDGSYTERRPSRYYVQS